MGFAVVVEVMRDSKSRVAVQAPGLSVVVIGRNEGGRLERCLRSVFGMNAPECPVEVVYVDSASVDGSVGLAERMGAKVIAIEAERPTAALGRNAGWRRTDAPFVLFLDGDTMLDPNFVVRALEEFNDQSVAVVWGRRRETNTSDSIYNKVLDLDWIYPPGLSDFCGGDALMRRSALEDVEGFDENLIAGEEPEMCRRLRAKNQKILHMDVPMTGHDLAITRWQQYWKRANRAGYAYAEVSERFRGGELPFWEREVRANRMRALILLLAPFLAGVAAAFYRRWWPIGTVGCLFLLLVTRTSWKARWKSSSVLMCLLYAVHSHLQQIPILVGQMQYVRDKSVGRRRGLIEYKQVAR